MRSDGFLDEPLTSSPPRKGKMGNNEKPRAGDWKCPNCNDLQFARNAACRRCNWNLFPSRGSQRTVNGSSVHPQPAVRRCVEEPQQESAAKAAKAQWSAMREDPEATKEAFWRLARAAISGLDEAKTAAADAEICARLRGYYPETLEVLRQAKEQDVVLGMISNHLAFWFYPETCHLYWRQIGSCYAWKKECGEVLKDLVEPELLLVSSEVACSKPGHRIFELFLERLGRLHPGLTAADCVFVDDKAENVAAAAALGFAVVHYDARKAQPGELAQALKDAGLALT
ncbi:unnamed protein product [Durusdinium trenchii]|uniref:RanBP2-type domain-containing protein n=1 Tax=Durusdinium trenchii TaxID=1381693 RepID=A0ABP0SIS5_9DINO